MEGEKLRFFRAAGEAPLGDARPREPVLKCCSQMGRHRLSCQDSTCQWATGEKKDRPACFSQHSSKLWTPELRSNPREGAGVARLKTPGRAEAQGWEKRAAGSETVLIKNITDYFPSCRLMSHLPCFQWLPKQTRRDLKETSSLSYSSGVRSWPQASVG